MRKRRSMRAAAAHQSLQSSCLEWLQREIRTSHLPRPRWLTRSPIRESPSCPPRSTLTSTSTSPSSEPHPLGRATAATLTSPPTGLSQPNTQATKTPPLSNRLQISTHLSK
ncbi:hypothetical protein NQD34_015157 [Periophthalmus magnuspinnatus]|nr:hypothetical protein NQD34_015157 [Periophthalmus magnuspinnatus]